MDNVSERFMKQDTATFTSSGMNEVASQRRELVSCQFITNQVNKDVQTNNVLNPTPESVSEQGPKLGVDVVLMQCAVRQPTMILQRK